MHMTVFGRAAARVALVSAIAALVACGPKPSTRTAGYEPLEETNKASLPAAKDGDPHPEEINLVIDPDYNSDEGDPTYGWGHGQGYIKAPIKDVWAAIQKVEVVVDRRNLASYSFAGHDTDKTADVSFTTDLKTKQGSFPYQTAWRQRATEGTKDVPTTVVARDELVKPVDIGAGIIIMTLISDSIVLTQVDDTTTSIAVIRHLQVLQAQEPGQYIKDLFASIKATVHGTALPTY
jgi:hypothetical protein